MAAEKAKRRASKRDNGPVQLAAALERFLSAYAKAATAGVSVLALTPAASAKIVYTPAYTPIPANQYVLVDLNHDGIADFGLYNLAVSGGAALSVGCALHSTFGIRPPRGEKCSYQTNQVWGRGLVSGRFASALPAGFKARANKSYFQTGKYPFGAVMGRVGVGRYGAWSTTGGQWLYAKNRYLGLQFVIKGQVHYGWARLSVNLQQPSTRGRGIYAVLTGYAYEDVPNKPIITGRTKGPDVVTLPPAALTPVTLGHLAGGASQIPAWRGARNGAGTLEDSPRKTGQGSQSAP